MGCYPLFACHDWSRLRGDCDALDGEVVTLGLVADPFGNFTEQDLQAGFDRVTRFKDHFVVDRARAAAPGKHHRYYARKAARDVEVERRASPPELLDAWVALYDNLVKRHGLRGIKAFSRRAFDVQLRTPGVVMLTATHRGELVGAHLWYVRGDAAYSHLMALSDAGYALNASYVLYWRATQETDTYLSPDVRRLDLGAGAGAGVGTEGTDGLTQFKRGWSNATCPVYFCGRVLDAERYARLTAASGNGQTDYFPAYRKGEFA
jgi:hypothetical protein